MRHESISVVYDSSMAIADEIANKLGAETISVQSLSQRSIESCQSFVLGIDFMPGNDLTPRWLYGFQMLLSRDLSGKAFAVFVALGSYGEHVAVNGICDMLKSCGARIVGDVLYVDSAEENIDEWIGTISPNM